MNVLEKFKLNNLVAVVTGAGKGIGRGIAISLAEAGADIVVASRNKKDLEETSIAISSVGKKCLVVPTDVTKKGELENLALKTKNEFGKIDIWVNNAGGLPDATPRYMSKTSEDEFDLQSNYTSNVKELPIPEVIENLNQEFSFEEREALEKRLAAVRGAFESSKEDIISKYNLSTDHIAWTYI